MKFMALTHFSLCIFLAPLFPGLIQKTKAIFSGRKGAPVFQTYYDLIRLFKKSSVFSSSKTWVFQAGGLLSFATTLIVLLLIPYGKTQALFQFSGDFVVVVYLLALGRFFTNLSALDVGFSFEGIGSSRDSQFATIGELAFLVGLVTLTWKTGGLSLTKTMAAITIPFWKNFGAILGLVTIALFLVLLAETARIPVDDSDTHLELTMIHEARTLDHSGFDLGLLLYCSSLKLWIFSALIVGLVLPLRLENVFLELVLFFSGMVVLSVIIGLVETTMARLSLTRVPTLLLAASALSFLALLIGLR